MKYKFIITLLFATLLVNIPQVHAEESNSGIQTIDNELSPCIEVTEYKYKYIRGVKYKRLWSVSRNCWIDKTWTPA